MSFATTRHADARDLAQFHRPWCGGSGTGRAGRPTRVRRRAGGGRVLPLGLGGVETQDGLPWYLVAGAAAAGAAAGSAVAALVRRAGWRTARRIFASTVIAVALLSCAPLLTLGLPTGTALVLASMHLLVGAVVLTVLSPGLTVDVPAPR